MHDNLHSVAFGFATPGFYYLSWAVIFFFFNGGKIHRNLPRRLSAKESACQCRGGRFKILGLGTKVLHAQGS